MHASSLPGLADVPDESPHYIRALGDMGNRREIVVREDVYAANGMKLLAKGARITGGEQERLNRHKLRICLDSLLTTESPVDCAMLAEDAGQLLQNDPLMARVAQRCGEPQGFRHALATLQLSAPLCFRLTVMREERNALYLHGLRVGLITFALAVRLRFSHQERHDLLFAALCHDMGEMHTDPELLRDDNRILPEQRRFIDVHPLTAYVLLQDMPGVPKAAIQAVLQHHERLDGSGYPHRLEGQAIGRLARLLCIAEVMEAVTRRVGLQQLDVVLRLSHRRLDQDAVNALRDLLRDDMPVAESDIDGAELTQQLESVARVLLRWRGLADQISADALLDKELAFLSNRMGMLRSLTLQTGIDPTETGALLDAANHDPLILAELRAALQELGWLMDDIAHEIGRRTPTVSTAARLALEALRECLADGARRLEAGAKIVSLADPRKQ